MSLLGRYLGGYYSQEGTDYCGAVSIFNLVSFLSVKNKILQNLLKQSRDTKNTTERRNALYTLYNILSHENASELHKVVPSRILMKNNLLETLEAINHKFVYGVDDGKYRQSFTPGKILRFLFQATADDKRFEFFTINSPNGVAAHTSRSVIAGLSKYYITVLIHRIGRNNSKYEDGLNNYLNTLVNTEPSIKGMMIGTDYHCLCLVLEDYNPPLLVNSWKTKEAHQTDKWSSKLGRLSATVILHTSNINFLDPDLVYQFPREIKALHKLPSYGINNLLELYRISEEEVHRIGKEIKYPFLHTLNKTTKKLIQKNGKHHSA